MPKQKRKEPRSLKTKDLTLGGLLVAFTLILLYLTLIFHHNTLTLLTLTSFMVSIALIRCGLKTACLVYISSGFLSFFLFPPKIIFFYILFFGVYSIIKSFIEKTKLLWVELILKLIFFNLILGISFVFMSEVLTSFISDKPLELIHYYLPQLPQAMILITLWVVLQLAFLLLDYALTLLIDFYYRYF